MKKVKTYSLDQVKDKVIGKKGTAERDSHEQELLLDIRLCLVKPLL